MTELTHSRLCALLDYDPTNGNFQWRVPRGGARRGDVAGRLHRAGYREISIDKRSYLAHRLAWLYVNGCWPTLDLDHRNGNRSDNRLDNLREATASQNQANRIRCPTNTSGYKGVSFSRATGRWLAFIRVNGRGKSIGYFRTPELAAVAYQKYAEDSFGEFARGGERLW